MPRDNSHWWFAPTVAAVVALVSVGVTLLVAAGQISANRDAANKRATFERQQLAAEARDQLQLAAVQVVLDAPSCDAALARATLAKAVLQDKLPADFVARVRAMKAGSFVLQPVTFFSSPSLSSDWAKILKRSNISSAKTNSLLKSASAAAADSTFVAQLFASARKAEQDRKLTCRALGQGH